MGSKKEAVYVLVNLDPRAPCGRARVLNVVGVAGSPRVKRGWIIQEAHSVGSKKISGGKESNSSPCARTV